MKLTVIFLFAIALQLSARTTAQTVTLSMKQAPLVKVFKAIQKQSGYAFVYFNNDLAGTKDVDIQLKSASLEEALNRCIAGQPLSYSISDKTIIIKRLNTVIPAEEIQAPPPVKITGTVLSNDNKPLAGASVYIEGTKIGTTTDANGKFELKAASNSGVLVISYVGYTTKKVTFYRPSDFSIVLTPTEDKTNDVVIVAYGTQKKATLTGSVAQVSGADVAKAPVANISNSLQGRLPGLQFQQTGGEPGNDAAAINIRGLGDALTIVDGVATDITQVNPNDIESVTILKDGAAAMYGFKAANGAIIITTKRGKSGKPVLSLDAYTGIQGNAVAYPKLVNAGEFEELSDEATINAAVANNPNAPNYTLPYSESEVQKWKAGTDSGYQSTDWYNVVMKNYAPMSNLNLSVRGGTDAVKYFVSGGVLNQDGLLRSGTSKYRRYNLRSNIDIQVSPRLKASFNVSGRLENRYSPPAGITFGSSSAPILQTVDRIYPMYTPYANNNPDYFANTNINGANPLALSSSAAGYDDNTWAVFNASGTVEYKIPYIDGLTAKLNFNYEYDNYNYKIWRKEYSLYGYDASTGLYSTVASVNNPSNLSQGTTQQGIPSDLQLSLNYEHTFGGAHHFTGLLLFQKTKTNGYGYGVARNFSIDALDQLALGDLLNQSINVNTNYQTAYMGYAGRINYDYKGTYLAEFGGRYDYSWKFPNGAGFFPEVSAGWVLTKEPFFHFRVINNLKLKASWARMPDDANFNGFNYLSGYNYPSGSYLFTAGTPTNGLGVGSYANTSLTWMVGTLYNAGVEWGLWNDMITGEVNVFYRKRTGLPATVLATYPGVAGINPPQANLNADNTRGYELQLGFNKKVGEVSLNISPNIAYSRTRNGFQINPPAGSAWAAYFGTTANRWANISQGYVAIGQFKTQQEINTSPIQDGEGNMTLHPGDIKYKDLTGDGVINGDDETFINRGSFPQIQYGLNISVAYKGFDFSVLFAGAADFDVTYSGELQDPFFNGASTFEFLTDRWHHEDPLDPSTPWVAGKYPSTIAGGSANNTLPSTFWTKSGSYLRLKNLNVGYSLSAKLLKHTGIQSARFYFSGQNLFILTGIKHLDPEAFAANGRGAYYPIQKVYTLGLNVGF